MYKVDVGEYSTPTMRLLVNVCELLQEQNKLLEQFSLHGNTNIVEDNKIENKANIDDMGRKEILALIKTLPQKPKGKYMTMGLEELRNQVKEVMKWKESL
jgi:Mg/Co/Ni transporter MgtE